jgi:hypothetical protein
MAVDRSIITPGWYWFDYPVEKESEWDQFVSQNRGKILVRKAFIGSTVRGCVFQVVETIKWTIGGLPTKAPKGSKTELSDMAKGPPPSPTFAPLLEELGEKIKGAATNANTALNVLIWGAVVVVLFNLYSATKTEGGGDDDDD